MLSGWTCARVTTRIAVGDLIEVVGDRPGEPNFAFSSTSALKKRAGTYQNRLRMPWETQWR